MINSPGFMPPPPIQGVNDTPTGGTKSSSGFSGPMFNFTFNPGGGIGAPTPQGGPTQGGYAGGGPGWMPPPPIQPVGDSGGFLRIDPRNTPPNFPPFDPRGGGQPIRQPFSPPATRMGGGLPGWAGYLAWLQMMGGGGRMPPPPIQGI